MTNPDNEDVEMSLLKVKDSVIDEEQIVDDENTEN